MARKEPLGNFSLSGEGRGGVQKGMFPQKIVKIGVIYQNNRRQ